MPTPALSLEVWLDRKAKIEEALKAGYPPPGTTGIHGAGAIKTAASSLKIGAASLQNSIYRAEQWTISTMRREGLSVPYHVLEDMRRYVASCAKPLSGKAIPRRVRRFIR